MKEIYIAFGKCMQLDVTVLIKTITKSQTLNGDKISCPLSPFSVSYILFHVLGWFLILG